MANEAIRGFAAPDTKFELVRSDRLALLAYRRSSGLEVDFK